MKIWYIVVLYSGISFPVKYIKTLKADVCQLDTNNVHKLEGKHCLSHHKILVLVHQDLIAYSHQGYL